MPEGGRKMLKKKDILIIEEYFINGFNKKLAFQKYHPNQNDASARTESSRFFRKQEVKEYVDNRMNDSITDAKTLTNKLLYNLEYDSFDRDIDYDFTWKEKQASQKMLIGMLEKLDTNGNLKNELEINIGYYDEQGNFITEI